ncbi:MAG TPA: hypothetical protein VGL10_06710 [Gammaproteobacteria bacterium]
METPVKPAQNPDKSGNGGAHNSGRNQLFDTTHPKIERAKSSVHEAVDRIADGAIDAADRLGARTDQLKELQQDLMETCSQYVRENPLKSLGIAVVSGLVLSRLLR